MQWSKISSCARKTNSSQGTQRSSVPSPATSILSWMLTLRLFSSICSPLLTLSWLKSLQRNERCTKIFYSLILSNLFRQFSRQMKRKIAVSAISVKLTFKARFWICSLARLMNSRHAKSLLNHLWPYKSQRLLALKRIKQNKWQRVLRSLSQLK